MTDPKLERALTLAIQEADKIEAKVEADRQLRAKRDAAEPELQPGELRGELAEAWHHGHERMKAAPDLNAKNVEMAFADFGVPAEDLDALVTIRVWAAMAACDDFDGYDPDEDLDGSQMATHVFSMLSGYGLELLLAGMIYARARDEALGR